MLVARGERSACDPATDVAYCAKEERLLGFSAGEGDLTRPSARPAGLVAIFSGRCRGFVPTGQLELRDRLRHNGHEELYLTIPSYALHVSRYRFFAQGWHLYNAVSLLQRFLSLPACKFRPTCRSCDRKSLRIVSSGVTLLCKHGTGLQARGHVGTQLWYGTVRTKLSSQIPEMRWCAELTKFHLLFRR
jgi:hypothetical protein